MGGGDVKSGTKEASVKAGRVGGTAGEQRGGGSCVCAVYKENDALL
jgi:hypothetical protein